MTRPVSAILIFIWLATIPRVVLAQQPTSCGPKLGAREYQTLADSLVTRGGGRPSGGYAQLEGGAIRATTPWGCTTVVALNWDGELGGGLLFLDQSGKIQDVASQYVGARHLRTFGRNRVLFEYTVARGSGLYESRHAVLCAVAEAAWIECFSTVSRKEITVAGPDAAYYREHGSIVAHGDSAVVSREITLRRQKEGRAARVRQRISVAVP